ncbi:hypothetical protein Dimus_037682 [Dionaea muscipula]
MAKTRNQRTVASTSTNHPPSHHDTETDLIREEEVADSTQDARNDLPPGDRNAQVAGENPPPTTPQVVPAGGSAPNLTPDVIQLLFQQQQQMQTLMNVLIEQRGAPVGGTKARTRGRRRASTVQTEADESSGKERWVGTTLTGELASS